MKTILKILITPFIFLLHALMVIAGLIFPTSMIMLYSFFFFICSPFVWILNLTLENKIEIEDPMFGEEYGKTLGHLLGVTLIAWVPFYAVWMYWKENKVLAFEMGF